MSELNLEQYVVAEEVTTPYLLDAAQEHHEQVMTALYAEANNRAKNGEHPFVQLEQFNSCNWPSVASIECSIARVNANRTMKMPYCDVERDINFNLVKVWEVANALLPNKVFFTTKVEFDHSNAWWKINVMLNGTTDTGLTEDELNIRLLRIVTETRVTRIY